MPAPTDVPAVAEVAPPSLSLSTVTSPVPPARIPVDAVTPSAPGVSPGPVQVSTDVGLSPPNNSNEPAVELTPARAAPVTGRTDTSTRGTSRGTAIGGQQSERSVPLGPASALVLASGAIGLIEARRRRRLRTAGYSILGPPDPAAALFEMQLRHRSNTERLARLDLSVRCAAPHLTANGLTMTGAIVSPTGEIDLLLDGDVAGACGPVEPFLQVGLTSWQLPATVATEDIPIGNRFAAFPSPLLAHVGVQTGSDIFVDIEAFGVLAVIGDEQRAESIVHGVMGSLAVSPFAETVSMSCVGMSLHAGALPRLRHFDEVADAVSAANEFAGASGSVDRSSGTMFDFRTRSSGEAWEPAVISMCGSDLDDSKIVAALAAAPAARGVVCVVDRDVAGAGLRMTETADGWRLSPLDLTIQPLGLTEDDLIELDELIADADLAPAPVPLVPLADEEAAFQEQPWSLMVRLLGPVEVVDASGTQATIAKSKALELVAWLAEHRQTSTRCGARSAMWDTEVRDATFANVVSEARRSLGRLVTPPEGMEWIARTLTEQLPLHPLVITDASLLQQRLDYARACADDEEAVYVLQPGLQLVRDVPFCGVNYLWSDAEGSLSNLTLLITAAATELGRRYLQLQNLEGVFWATGRGLVVLPGHEDLIALRMRARHHAGDLAGLRNEWDSYERVLHADSWSDGEPSARMESVRQELLRPTLTRRS